MVPYKRKHKKYKKLYTAAYLIIKKLESKSGNIFIEYK